MSYDCEGRRRALVARVGNVVTFLGPRLAARRIGANIFNSNVEKEQLANEEEAGPVISANKTPQVRTADWSGNLNF